MSFDFIKYDEEHYRRIERHAAKIRRLYNEAIREAAQLAGRIDFDPNKPFAFADYPKTRAKAEALFNKLADDVQAVVTSGTSAEWGQSNIKNDALVESIMGSALSPEQMATLMPQNLSALKAFQGRKIGGMDLSDRVWKYTSQFGKEIEMALDVGLSDGRSAAQLSRDVRSYMQNPDKLFRRVRDARGALQLSKNAANYHPGQGVYRSSYKNAMRLTRTEINMSYRNADFERYQGLDFILGIEVRLSNNHPVPDICDDLKGKYPKEFVFAGWHPQCRCHALPILPTKAEMDSEGGYIDKILNGDPTADFGGKNRISGLPDNFNKWMDENKERMKGWKSEPWFVKDNEGVIASLSNKSASPSRI